MLLECGGPASAEDPIHAALRLQPQSAQALFGIARLRTQQVRFSTAFSNLEQAFKSDPNSLEVLMKMGAAYARDGRYREEVAVLAALVESHPDAVSTLLYLDTACASARPWPQL